ncbi:hypothetical protein Nepgr_008396 [Nepenthes gracilis]|uniref:Alpha-mannosidase n=1 Tax=Nepenthes gracilis TaxID=150966 RepID=A0AAD3XJE3_NEPGR|nr:hypothetical protein Nepgr_008396 [Nepenthes gracilis]
MEKLVASVSAFLCIFVGFSSPWSIHCVKYETGSGVKEGKLNVHLVPHSHDDVGWLKTVDQYYVGSNNGIQIACVENELDSIVEALCHDPNRKFVFAEQAFFHRWWATQDKKMQEEVRKLVDVGQLEFVNGGWSMHDEATVHYIDMIDQTTLGHWFIKEQFNKTPRAGWQIDPFGHSAVQAYLLGAEIFTNAFPVHYGPPPGFQFEVNDASEPVQDNPLLYEYNVYQRVDDFIQASIVQANVTRTNHIMWTMGGDFQYQYAESWFKQMDKLIHYVNKDGRVNALYSTPSIYVDAKFAANETWPIKSHDYLPYADRENAYWTGFFTSRPAFKRYVRALSGYYLAARQLEFLAGRSNGTNTFSLGDALGTAQHHDAITGTSKQHTTNDYAKRLAVGAYEAETVVNSALSYLVGAKLGSQSAGSTVTFGQCQLINISYCPPTEQDLPEDMSLVVVAYNPLGWSRNDTVRIPVNGRNIVVQDSVGNVIEAQYNDIENVTINLRSFYEKAYLGISSEQFPKYWLFFRVSVPPLGWSTYFISGSVKGGSESTYLSMTDSPQNQTVDIGPGNLKMSFSSSSGLLMRMFNSKTGVDVPIQQSFSWYASNTGKDGYQVSGAYIFRPSGSPPGVSRSIPNKVLRGPLVDEIHQQFDSWIYQVTRLYKDKEHAEVEFTIGPIPTNETTGKEVITRIKADMATNAVFYTDSNGRDFLKRIRDHREDWNLTVNEPVAGNYYPINLGIYVTDNKSELSVLVDRATGGTSMVDGEVELMLHRRTLLDDSRGVEEPLDETVCLQNKCEGLTVRGNYYININHLGAGARWRRTVGQEIYSPLLLAFAREENWKPSHQANSSFMDPNYCLPPNVVLITLQELEDGRILIRLAHLYEADEDLEYSTMATIELKKVFAGKEIKEVKETSLSANQGKWQMRRLNWKVEGDNDAEEPSPIRGGPVDASTLVVELGPMEIRTFLLKF